MSDQRRTSLNSTLFFDEYSEMPREQLIKRVGKKKFFHDMDFGDCRTSSYVYDATQPPNYHLFPAFAYLNELDLVDSHCIDIGSFDGMTAFVLSQLGAKSVDATCQHDLERFRMARALGGYKNVAYHPKTDLEKIRRTFDPYTHDLVVMSAMLHHLISPLEGLLDARRLLKIGGFLVLEVVTVNDSANGLTLNTIREDPVYGSPTIWLPSEKAAEGMLNLACFEVLSSTRLLGGKVAREKNYDRITFLARAVSPGSAPQDSKTAEIYDTLNVLGPLHLTELANSPSDANISFNGAAGKRTLNIWNHYRPTPLQPTWSNPHPEKGTRFSIGSVADFRSLASRQENGMFEWEDIYLLGARCPGETMPDGMRWGLKQLGNLHILEHIQRWGCQKTLEVGAGFNLYFDRHLPPWVDVDVLDDEGFYDQSLLNMAIEARTRGQTFNGLLGASSKLIADETYDACFSSSVLEHIPPDAISGACQDMFRLLQPGGWAIHSLDLRDNELQEKGQIWLKALQASGFMIASQAVSIELDKLTKNGFVPLSESLAIEMRFYHGYKKNIWGDKTTQRDVRPNLTILIAMRKPQAST